MTVRRVGLAALGLAIALPVSLVGPTPSATADDDRPPGKPGWTGWAAWTGGTGPTAGAPQTSDGIAGRRALPLPLAKVGDWVRTDLAAYPVVPGLGFERFELADSRGRVRVQLLRADLSAPGLSLDYLSPRHVTTTAGVLGQVKADRGIAGVNGDFFDIGDTGAPLGVGKDRQRGPVHGPVDGWNQAFYLDHAGTPRIGTLAVRSRIRQHPRIAIEHRNSPSVRMGGIGVYTQAWGTLRDYRVTDGQRKRVRMVAVRNGRVLWNKVRFPRRLPVTGKVLVGRGKGADALRRLTRGKKVTILSRTDGSPQVAITGNQVLLRAGKRTTGDDVDMHPRTAVGIDRDTGQVLLMVVDGRQSFSRGLTMVEMSVLMRQLGAEDALNLDGGGSSTMVTKRPSGTVGIVNSPSDGRQRQVPNGLVLHHR
ncbi:phosphodiester glycosidase family protein [Nocardioides sp. SYSU D00038]|uniref:phosphodiester glycosidase family protein n=1 Tax=Nocardioides sp. SYSU D00038 TaxID=2812554 RepID=UPI001966E3C6|nr:phosphodiester glycosidase family protein [Nocardioides sp. SYSU D00038]